MRAVNLLPRDEGQRTLKKESLPVLIGACSGVLVAAVLGAMFMMGSGKVAAQQRKLDDLNRIYQALPPPPAGPSAAQQQLAGEQSARGDYCSSGVDRTTHPSTTYLFVHTDRFDYRRHSNHHQNSEDERHAHG